MSRDMKIARIYEVIADKTLSTGLLWEDPAKQKFIILEIYPVYYKVLYLLWGTNNIANVDKEVVTIIWHKVMIGDVLDWHLHKYNCRIDTAICARWCWDKKRLPIEDQSDDCVDDVYSLLPQDDNL